MMDRIKYTGNYKYRLEENWGLQLPPEFATHQKHVIPYIVLTSDGFLSLSEGYAWDGPSGPVIDTDENLRASLVHDALYQLLRYEILEPKLRDAADILFRKISIYDGVWRIQAWGWYAGLRWRGAAAADPKNKKIVREAP